MKNKILTITIPSYNTEQYIRDIIPTYIDNRILEDIEILIVNDGSKDNTEEIANQFEAMFPESIKVINKENGGHGSTINTGIQYATGKYFKVIDGDDWVDTEQFVNFVLRLKECEADVVICPFVIVNDSTGEKTIRSIKNIEENKTLSFHDAILNINDEYQLHSCTFKTNIIKQIDKIDEHCFYVDQEYILYPLHLIQTAIFFNYPVYQYRLGNETQSVSTTSMQRNREMHKRVIFSLLTLLNKNRYNTVLDHFISNRISKMCRTQIEIYFSMNTSITTKNELLDFLNQVKTRNINVYNNITGRKIVVLRLLGGVGYWALAICLKIGIGK